MHAAIKAIEYYLPSTVLSNEQLALEFPDFPAEKIYEKTGIRERHVSDSNEFASDMAISAAMRLFENNPGAKKSVDFVLFCTQTPDYLLPTSACIIQDKLGLPAATGAMDFNLGCSGFVYGLSIAKGLIESQQARNVLLLTADTYTKLLEKSDKSVRTIFGDGAAATLISGVEHAEPCISPVLYGTNGAGWSNLCVRGRGIRYHDATDADPFLRMHGTEIFSFTLDAVPASIHELLSREQLCLDDIDLFVFHQANHYMLEHLRKKIGIPADKFFVAMDFCGNTVSSSIPIALREAQRRQALSGCRKIMLVGFGVGYSWAACIIDGEYIG
ncbi:ketoacyl-ACP synthase III [Legionella geestiana]|nr:ketoacyl-ACP synthase III [Legionella geestiana]